MIQEGMTLTWFDFKSQLVEAEPARTSSPQTADVFNSNYKWYEGLLIQDVVLVFMVKKALNLLEWGNYKYA